MKNRFRFYFLLSLLALALVACAGMGTATNTAAVPSPQAPAASQAPTSAPAPTSTPRPTALPTLTVAPTPALKPGPDQLFVDAGLKLGPISPLVYGSNFGPWLFISNTMMPQARAAKFTLLRWPGGNWGDQNDIEEWQLDQFMAMCRDFKAEPFIHVRLLGGTPEKAAALVRYANITKGYKVKWWAIGNEPNLLLNMDVQTYVKEWRQFAEAMRAVDPTIKLMGPETSQFTFSFVVNPPTDPSQGSAWRFLNEFLKVNGDMVDLVSIHRYPFPSSMTSGAPSIEELKANSKEWDQIIPALRALIRQQAGRDLPVGVTEVNSSWAPNIDTEGSMNMHYNAIWWGDSLGRMIRQGVDVVAQFSIVGQQGLMDSYQVFPTYYVYIMYQNFGTERVQAVSEDADVSVFAARRPDGALTIMVINLGSKPATKQLTVAGFKTGAPVETWLFDPDHPAVKLNPGPLGETLTLPGRSMTLLVIPAQ